MVRTIILISILLGMQYNCNAQHYRIVIDKESLPELYNTIFIEPEQQSDDIYTPLKSKYRLQTTDALLQGNRLTFDRKKLHHNNGKINFTLTHKGKNQQLVLELPVLKNIRFNLYADSIKTVLNYYLNVEGIFTNGKIYPLDTGTVTITADKGTVNGMEWLKPPVIDFDKVTFVAICRYDVSLTVSNTVYLKKPPFTKE